MKRFCDLCGKPAQDLLSNRGTVISAPENPGSTFEPVRVGISVYVFIANPKDGCGDLSPNLCADCSVALLNQLVAEIVDEVQAKTR